MEIITKKYDAAISTLKTLDEAILLLKNPKYQDIQKSMRDSAIQRFEYSIDTFWKFLKIYLQEVAKVEIESASPRSILRQSLHNQIINENEFKTLITGITDRNLTSHSYNEQLADQIIHNLPKYYSVMDMVLQRIKIV